VSSLSRRFFGDPVAAPTAVAAGGAMGVTTTTIAVDTKGTGIILITTLATAHRRRLVAVSGLARAIMATAHLHRPRIISTTTGFIRSTATASRSSELDPDMSTHLTPTLVLEDLGAFTSAVLAAHPRTPNFTATQAVVVAWRVSGPLVAVSVVVAQDQESLLICGSSSSSSSSSNSASSGG